MINQRIIWTALPNGLTPDNLNYQISVFISPRLFTDEGAATETLASFPDWLDWPGTAVSFSVTIGGTTPVPVTVTSPPPSPVLWKALFKSTTFVEPYVYTSISGQNFHSYPTNFLREWFVSTYSALCNESPTDYPSLADLGLGPGGNNGPYGALPTNQDLTERAITTIGDWLVEGVSPPTGGPAVHAIGPAASGNPLTDFEQAELFLQPLTTVPAKFDKHYHPAKPSIDFHKMVSMLGQYPSLLRLFGLVYDLEVPIPGGLSAPAALSVTPTWTPLLAATTNVLPAVQSDPVTWRAFPRPTNPEIAEGLLRMSDPVPSQPSQPGYPLLELEIDGSTLKTLNFARGVERATTTMASSATPSAYAVPALRSAGLAVAHTGQALDFGQGMQQADSLDASVEVNSPVTLYAEDVVRGFRIDAWDSGSNAWHQLCARSAAPALGGYLIGKGAHPHVEPVPTGEEGWVELSLAQGDAGGSNDSYLSELIFRWSGWSLVAQRPGQHLSEDPSDGLEPPANNPPTGDFPLQVSFAATPGTLPLLRFGLTYAFRARAVDLAGNSIGFDPTATAVSFTYATPQLRYGRVEPLQSPLLVAHDPRGELVSGQLQVISPGEHLERPVIRSEMYDTPAADVSPTSRHVVPPSQSELMSETQGQLDTSSHAPDPTLYPTIAALAGVTYSDAAVISSLGGATDPGSASAPYYPVDNLAVPYLPDAYVAGACLQNVPGSPAPLLIPFGGPSYSWPATLAFRMEVQAGPGAPILPNAGNNYTLTIFAPKATVQVMRLSSYLDASSLESMALWEWLEETGFDTPANKSILLSGEAYMITPYREVTIVHAVRQPLTVPQFTAPYITRDLGKTFALLGDTIEVDYMSSQKLDIFSVWSEPFDDGINPIGSVELPFNCAVGEVTLDLTNDTATSVTIPSAGPPAVPSLRHDFGDTKYRLVYYEARSTSRFLEYFTESVSVTLTDATPATVDPGGMATGTVVVSSEGSGSTPSDMYQPTIDYTEDDVAGTITAIEGGAIIGSHGGTATVNVSYVPPPVTRSSLEEVVAPATATGYPLIVPSTARPSAPDVRYVLPLFSFTDTTSTSPPGVTSVRAGNAVRVYLGRPWWSSGDGELLGALVWEALGGPFPPATYEPFATRYGRDPLFETNPAQGTPTLANFSLAAATAENLTIPETGSATVWSVAGHTVGFDTAHLLWYADLAIDTSVPSGSGSIDSYWPFVRLGLVRYQPNSLAGVECSAVVVADFVKLASDRTAGLTFPTTSEVSIAVSGVSFGSGPAPLDGTSVMYATVETQLAGVTDPDLQWVGVPGSTVQLEPTFTGSYGVSWTGTVALPAPQGSQPFRIRIEEFELIPSAVPTLGVPPPAQRRTYIDTLQI